MYHGRLILPKDYPLSPPRFQVWTPSGRYQPHTDICLSVSNFHPESWSPTLTIPALVRALKMHMLTLPNEVGGISSSLERSLQYAKQSWTWSESTGRFEIDHKLLVRQGAITTNHHPQQQQHPQEQQTDKTEDDKTNDKDGVNGSESTSIDSTVVQVDQKKKKKAKKNKVTKLDKKDKLLLSTTLSSGVAIAKPPRSDHHHLVDHHQNRNSANLIATAVAKVWSSKPVRWMVLMIVLYVWFRP